MHYSPVPSATISMSSDCFVILAMADITVHSLPLIGFPDFGIDANASNANRAIRSL